MTKYDSHVGAVVGAAHQEVGDFMLTPQTDGVSSGVIDELGGLLSSLADPDTMLGSRSVQWSRRKSLAFIVISSAGLWSVLALSLTKILAVI